VSKYDRKRRKKLVLTISECLEKSLGIRMSYTMVHYFLLKELILRS